mmetsp:Transcript_259/g.563  ORF Transcript_259/g.563 Transcript_259/m.563 type:complete len:217 (+) Transcript_259:930-1580(+)
MQGANGCSTERGTPLAAPVLLALFSPRQCHALHGVKGAPPWRCRLLARSTARATTSTLRSSWSTRGAECGWLARSTSPQQTTGGMPITCARRPGTRLRRRGTKASGSMFGMAASPACISLSCYSLAMACHLRQSWYLSRAPLMARLLIGLSVVCCTMSRSFPIASHIRRDRCVQNGTAGAIRVDELLNLPQRPQPLLCLPCQREIKDKARSRYRAR